MTTATPTRTTVTSADGTQIAVFASGSGRPLVAVPGTTSDHHSWRFVLPYLEPRCTVYAVDRRGRGDSGDHPEYSLEKEHADIAAVVDAAAASYGGPVDLIGHSYGGNVAFGAAIRTSNVRKLLLYEGWPVPNADDRTYPPEQLAHLEHLLAAGEREELLERMLRDIAGVSAEEFRQLRAAPTWPARVAAAHTVPREIRAFGAQAFDPRQAAKITVPVLLMVGADSPPDVQADPDVVAAALPDARICMLPGQMHMAHFADAANFAAQVLNFLSE